MIMDMLRFAATCGSMSYLETMALRKNNLVN